MKQTPASNAQTDTQTGTLVDLIEHARALRCFRDDLRKEEQDLQALLKQHYDDEPDPIGELFNPAGAKKWRTTHEDLLDKIADVQERKLKYEQRIAQLDDQIGDLEFSEEDDLDDEEEQGSR